MNANEHKSKILRWVCVYLCLFVAHLFVACGKTETPSPDPELTLQVISPHGSDIRREFGEAFSNWHQQTYGTPVKVEWPDIGGGGTSNVVRQLNASYAHADSSGYDVFFGGGSATFNTLAAQVDEKGHPRGILVPLPPAPAGEQDPLADVPRELFGNPLRGAGDVWIAATMARFGMVINKDRIAELGLQPPRAWEDLAGPQWIDRLSLADPSKSGSVKTSYEQIFQAYGWEKGWAIMTRLFANTAMVREGGSNPADDVGSADALAGIVIDFFGRLQMSRAGTSIVGFVVPDGKDGTPGGGSVLDADPIGLLKGAPHQELAAQFIRFVLSPAGQRLWVLRAGTEGGPRKSSLGRLSVLPSLYQSDADKMLDPASPFDARSSLKLDPKGQSERDRFIGDLIKSALIDNRAALVRARLALRKHGDPPELMAKLEAPPTYRIAHIDHDQIVYDTPAVMTAADLAKVRDEYAPPKDSGKVPYAERLQNGLKDFWRESFAQRFAAVESAVGLQ